MKLDSSWEEQLAIRLDDLNIDWVEEMDKDGAPIIEDDYLGRDICIEVTCPSKNIDKRRAVGYNIDFDWIKDDKIRATCENKCANLGIRMQINPSKFKDISSLIEAAIKLDNDSVSF